MKLLDIFFSDFRWYRLWRGGTWYKVFIDNSVGGLGGDIIAWTQTKPPAGMEETIMKTENN